MATKILTRGWHQVTKWCYVAKLENNYWAAVWYTVRPTPKIKEFLREPTHEEILKYETYRDSPTYIDTRTNLPILGKAANRMLRERGWVIGFFDDWPTREKRDQYLNIYQENSDLYYKAEEAIGDIHGGMKLRTVSTKGKEFYYEVTKGEK